VNWRQRHSKGVGDILGEKQHRYFMMGIVVVLNVIMVSIWCHYDSKAEIVVVLEYLFKIRYSCSRLERDYFRAA
jgi:hypothetical protein